MSSRDLGGHLWLFPFQYYCFTSINNNKLLRVLVAWRCAKVFTRPNKQTATVRGIGIIVREVINWVTAIQHNCRLGQDQTMWQKSASYFIFIFLKVNLKLENGLCSNCIYHIQKNKGLLKGADEATMELLWRMLNITLSAYKSIQLGYIIN